MYWDTGRHQMMLYDTASRKWVPLISGDPVGTVPSAPNATPALSKDTGKK